MLLRNDQFRVSTCIQLANDSCHGAMPLSSIKWFCKVSFTLAHPCCTCSSRHISVKPFVGSSRVTNVWKCRSRLETKKVQATTVVPHHMKDSNATQYAGSDSKSDSHHLTESVRSRFEVFVRESGTSKTQHVRNPQQATCLSPSLRQSRMKFILNIHMIFLHFPNKNKLSAV